MGQAINCNMQKKGKIIILLLNGGDKSTQSRDIKKAKEILNDLEDKND